MTDAQIFTAIQKALEGVPPELTGEALDKLAEDLGVDEERVIGVFWDGWFRGGAG